MPAGQGSVGRNIILKWNGVKVAGVREKSVAINGEGIDVGDDDSGGWREMLDVPGEQSVDIGLSGVMKSAVLRIVAFSPTDRIGAVTLEYEDGGIISGDFYLATFSEGMPYKDGTTFETSLKSSGEVTYTAGP